MNPQQKLMNMQPPASHYSDPESSYLAEAMINETGIRRESQKVVYRAVAKYNGLTSAELAIASGLDYHEVARRLSELTPYVKKGAIRICDVSDKNRVTWWLA